MSTAPVVIIQGARAITLAGPSGPRRGTAMSDLGILPNADIFIDGARITKVIPCGSEPLPPNAFVIEANGRAVLPGFVDCHTHACFAGSRINEWELKLRGVPYLDILRAGGGIMSTVQATRSASIDELSAIVHKRLEAMLQGGTTTAEVKSGYGLTLDGELAMLRATLQAVQKSPNLLPSVVQTALLGHATEGDHSEFVTSTITKTLPTISREFPGIAVDAFCELGAWTIDDVRQLFQAARSAGHPLRLHADQFNSLGGLPLAIEFGATSVDHLEASTPADLTRLANSATIGVGLPACGFHLDGRFANLRSVIDAGGAAAIASNFNPGSAPSTSIPFAMALAVRHCGLSPAESIAAVTVNAAAVLKLADRGRIEAGLVADLIILDDHDERVLAYAFADDPILHVLSRGLLVR